MSNNSRHPRILIDILRRREGEIAQAALLSDDPSVVAGVPQGTSSAGTQAAAQAIEARAADPTGTDLYEGRVWEIGGVFKFFTGTITRLLNVLTTKGDLHTFGTTDVRLPVGADGQYLTALSTAASGLAWGPSGAPVFTTKGDLWTRQTTGGTDSNFALLSSGASATALNQYSTFAPSNTIDGSDTTEWIALNYNAGMYLQVDLGVARAIYQYRILWSSNIATSVKLQSSPDGTTWTDRDTHAGIGTESDTGRLVLTGGPFTFRYWRLLITGPSVGPGNTNSPQIFTLELRDSPTGSANVRLPLGADGTMILADSSIGAGLKYVSGDVDLEIVLDGGGAAITVGVKLDLPIDFACVVIAWTLLLDVAGSIQIDLWKNTYANYPPVAANGMPGVAGNRPQVAAALKATGTVAAWTTTAIAAGDTLRVNVDSAATAARAILALKLRRT